MPRTSASTKPRIRAYAPSVVAKRKPKGDPAAPREVLIRDLTSAEVDAIDAELDASNAAKRTRGDKSSRSSMLAAWVRVALDEKRAARGLAPLSPPDAKGGAQ